MAEDWSLQKVKYFPARLLGLSVIFVEFGADDNSALTAYKAGEALTGNTFNSATVRNTDRSITRSDYTSKVDSALGHTVDLLDDLMLDDAGTDPC